MNVAASTYDLRLPAPVAQTETAPPTDSFVTRLVTSLVWTFDLDESERELAVQLLFGRSAGAIARSLGVCGASVARRCRALFRMTGTDGREKLFEVALRLTAMRELSELAANGRPAGTVLGPRYSNKSSRAETVPARTIHAWS
ncbi:hypothetical protein ENSA5_18230 [Enhygromyxa salina]|uniref:HTH luxR-type domain-containing protein n=1 Tax=Enhygromyxa salina TaxID=215803 RepID=A0A2S9YDC9_9BACT|nr:hypothetical protein [Enhygromyxa salina]PRQ03052.1 hypothetical protein ENSA5_18230 [Enhygromyxa salina]